MRVFTVNYDDRRIVVAETADTLAPGSVVTITRTGERIRIGGQLDLRFVGRTCYEVVRTVTA
jgi:hypothetical protein